MRPRRLNLRRLDELLQRVDDQALLLAPLDRDQRRLVAVRAEQADVHPADVVALDHLHELARAYRAYLDELRGEQEDVIAAPRVRSCLCLPSQVPGVPNGHAVLVGVAAELCVERLGHLLAR